MTLRVSTDVTGMMPRTRMGGLLDEAEWASSHDRDDSDRAAGDKPIASPDAGVSESDATQTHSHPPAAAKKRPEIGQIPLF